MVARLTVTPWVWAHWAQCSASVASGCTATCSRKAACSAAPIARGRPGIGLGASDAVAACWAIHRCTVARPTWNRCATAVLGWPATTAWTTRVRRSSEYGFMLPGYHLAQPFRKLL